MKLVKWAKLVISFERLLLNNKQRSKFINNSKRNRRANRTKGKKEGPAIKGG
jgi:hypothetical protein